MRHQRQWRVTRERQLGIMWELAAFFTARSTMWDPPVLSWFINPIDTIVIRRYKYHKPYLLHLCVFMFTNLAIKRGPTLYSTETKPRL